MHASDRLRNMRIAKVLAAGIAAVTLAGCASASGSVPGPAVQPQWTSCAADAPPPTLAGGGGEVTSLPRLGTGFTPTAVVVCTAQVDQRADGGQDLVAVESRSDDVAALVTALRLPNQAPTGDACDASLPIIAWFALLDAQGQWIRPGVPEDGCAKPRVEVRTAIGGLHLTRISTRPIRQIESGAAQAAGCSQNYADMVTVETAQGRVTGTALRSDLFPASVRLRLCVYRVPQSELGTSKPAGDFEHGTLLLPESETAIEQSLVGPAAAKCSTESTRFALLTPEGGPGTTVYVELDGCRRIMVDAGSGKPILAQADAALIALLDR
jgi:hypothetical protein